MHERGTGCVKAMIARVINEFRSQMSLFDRQAGVYNCIYGCLDRCKRSGKDNWTRVDIPMSLRLQTYTETLDLACKEISILFVAIEPQYRW